MKAKTKTRDALLTAALQVLREKGYGSATVDDICRAAGVSKGAFFHHFATKDELALAAAEHFTAGADALFAAADYRTAADPRDRLLGYIDLRASLMRGELPDFTCLLGTMVQETYATHPAIRDACREQILHHAEDVAHDVAAAKTAYAPNAPWSADSLALFTQAVIQGAFVLAKAHDDPAVATECVTHLRRYVASELPLTQPKAKGK
jgi:TetR/AcrR family transcriptional regulator, transcriptional repressor for nem operon